MLPGDSLGFVPYALFIIPMPKTRASFARTQSARIEPSDVVALLTLVFGRLLPEEPLWPASPATFRSRFKALRRALELPCDRPRGGGPRLELASLRGGGATDLFLASEDWGLVQTRGRWLSLRTMQIYVQELVSTSFFSQLPQSVQVVVLAAARAAPGILAEVFRLAEEKADEATVEMQLRGLTITCSEG